jgi:hypothetical protein
MTAVSVRCIAAAFNTSECPPLQRERSRLCSWHNSPPAFVAFSLSMSSELNSGLVCTTWMSSARSLGLSGLGTGRDWRPPGPRSALMVGSEVWRDTFAWFNGRTMGSWRRASERLTSYYYGKRYHTVYTKSGALH